MGKSITDLSSVATIGVDLAKHVFQVHGVDASAGVDRRSDEAKQAAGEPGGVDASQDAADVGLALHTAAQRAARPLNRHARDLADMIEACDVTILLEVCEVLAVQLRNLRDAITPLEHTIAKLAQRDETARQLMSIPDFGPDHLLGDGGDHSGWDQLRRPARVRGLSRTDSLVQLFGR
jgi:hypothetical protein